MSLVPLTIMSVSTKSFSKLLPFVCAVLLIEYALDTDPVLPSGSPCSEGARLVFHVADEPTTAPATVETTTADAAVTSGSNSMPLSEFL